MRCIAQRYQRDANYYTMNCCSPIRSDRVHCSDFGFFSLRLAGDAGKHVPRACRRRRVRRGRRPRCRDPVAMYGTHDRRRRLAYRCPAPAATARPLAAVCAAESRVEHVSQRRRQLPVRRSESVARRRRAVRRPVATADAADDAAAAWSGGPADWAPAGTAAPVLLRRYISVSSAACCSAPRSRLRPSSAVLWRPSHPAGPPPAPPARC
jgi:hypothetical protein